jgi:hypothetical protein
MAAVASFEHELGASIKQRYQKLVAKRAVWESIYALVTKYVWLRDASFSNSMVPGMSPKITVADVADDVVADYAKTAANALGGVLWPNVSESFELVLKASFANMSDRSYKFQTEEIRRYWLEATTRMRAAFDHPEAQHQVGLGEHFDAQVVLGTSGMLGEETPDDTVPFRFRSISIENCVIDESVSGRIDTVMLESAYTARQVIQKYGSENVSDAVRDKAKNEKGDDYVKVIQAVYPRVDGKPGGANMDKPWASVHVEVDTGKVLLDSGMDENSIFMVRLRKLPNEMFGRSFAMDALPTLRELNVLRKGYSSALGKILNPPMGYLHDMIGGAGVLDLSMGARVPLYNTGKIPQGMQPVMNLLPLAEPRVAVDRLEQLREQAATKFLIDRLLDFNNKTRMTMGEAEMRNDFRNQALGSIFARQITELFYPKVVWAFKVMYRRKLLGLHPVEDRAEIMLQQAIGMTPLVIPGPIADMMDSGVIPFTVNFISPAARAMRAASMQGMHQLTNFLLSFVNAGSPEIMDIVEIDEMGRAYQGMCGAPGQVMRSQEKIEVIRKARDQARMAQGQAAQEEQASGVQKNLAKAAKDLAQAGIMPDFGGMSV